jgi:SAM-dependent methyltransferase
MGQLSNLLDRLMLAKPSRISDSLLSKMADPIDRSPAKLTRSFIKTARRRYQITSGFPDMMVEPSVIENHFGRRNYAAWRNLQDAAEKSYAVRTEGHFSVDGFDLSEAYGSIVSEFRGEWLDVGCGKLPKPSYMKKAAEISFYGIDPIDFPVAREFPFVRGTGDFLPFGENTFDGVMFSSSLDHCVVPLQSLEEAYRVIRPGGHVLVWDAIRTENPRYLRWRTAAVYFQSQYNTHHNWAFTKESLPALLELAGFTSPTWHEMPDQRTGVISAVKPVVPTQDEQLILPPT